MAQHETSFTSVIVTDEKGERMDVPQLNEQVLDGVIKELKEFVLDKEKEENKMLKTQVDLMVQITVEDGSPVTDIKGKPIDLKTLIIACLSVGDSTLEDRAERFYLVKKLMNKDLTSLNCGALSQGKSEDMSLILKWVDKTIHSPFLWGRVREELGAAPNPHTIRF